MQRKRRLLGVFALTGMLIWSATPGVALGLGTDTTNPESWVQIAPAANDNGWHKSDVTLNFYGYDGQTGLSNLEYKVDEGMWQTGNQCKVTTEGNHNIYYRAVARAGNIEIAKSHLIKLDKTLPTVTIPVELNRAFRNTDVFTVDFNATDTLAGLDQVTTKLDDMVVSKGQVIPLNNFAVGSHNLQVIATDRAGNRVTQNTQFGVTTTQDTTAPATIVGLPLANSNGWYKEPLKIKIKIKINIKNRYLSTESLKKQKHDENDEDDDKDCSGKGKKKGWGHVKKQGRGHYKHGDD